jgi:hypothetical protein
MSEASKHRLGGNGVHEGYSALMGNSGAFVEAATQASQNYMQRVAALNEEILGFAATRMQKNSEASESLMKCKDLADAMRIQQDWVRAMTEQYMQEAGRILEMTTKAALAGFSAAADLRAPSGEIKKAS